MAQNEFKGSHPAKFFIYQKEQKQPIFIRTSEQVTLSKTKAAGGKTIIKL